MTVEPGDLRLLEIVQDGIPITPRPFESLGRQLGMTEEEILRRLHNLKTAGIVIGISPVLEPRHLGIGAATLVALRVPEERVEEVARLVSSCPAVSHNYRRDHEYSIWFTLSARDTEQLSTELAGILGRARIPKQDVLNLPTVQKLKIGVRFSFAPGGVPAHG